MQDSTSSESYRPPAGGARDEFITASGVWPRTPVQLYASSHDPPGVPGLSVNLSGHEGHCVHRPGATLATVL